MAPKVKTAKNSKLPKLSKTVLSQLEKVGGHRYPSGSILPEISLIRLIKIFATVLLLWRADLIHWGFLDAF
jgi:hypothetical protein